MIPRNSADEDDLTVFCGPLTIKATGKSILLGLHFDYSFRPGNYPGKIAPTIWTNIEDVNVFDERIQWYGVEERKSSYIPIDKLWEEKK